MVELNPYEYTIVSFLEEHPSRRFTASEIARNCGINLRTSTKHCNKLTRRKMIKKEEVRGKRTVLYFVE